MVRVLLFERNCTLLVMTGVTFIKQANLISSLYPQVHIIVTSNLRSDEQMELRPNLAFASAKIWEVCFLAGIAAGSQAKKKAVGFLQTVRHPTAVAIANAFFMGVSLVCPGCVMYLYVLNKYRDKWGEVNALEDFLVNRVREEAERKAKQKEEAAKEKERAANARLREVQRELSQRKAEQRKEGLERARLAKKVAALEAAGVAGASSSSPDVTPPPAVAPPDPHAWSPLGGPPPFATPPPPVPPYRLPPPFATPPRGSTAPPGFHLGWWEAALTLRMHHQHHQHHHLQIFYTCTPPPPSHLTTWHSPVPSPSASRSPSPMAYMHTPPPITAPPPIAAPPPNAAPPSYLTIWHTPPPIAPPPFPVESAWDETAIAGDHGRNRWWPSYARGARGTAREDETRLAREDEIRLVVPREAALDAMRAFGFARRRDEDSDDLPFAKRRRRDRY
eukprot:g14051.t1